MRATIAAIAVLMAGCEQRTSPTPRQQERPQPPATTVQVAAIPAAEPASTKEETAAAIDAVFKRNAQGEELAKFLWANDYVATKGGDKVTFAKLKKNAKRYEGIPWDFSGRIVEIVETDDGTRARIALDYYGNSVVFVTSQFQTDFVEGDTVDVGGILVGEFTYTSQAKWEISIPALLARAIAPAGTFKKLRAETRKNKPAWTRPDADEQ